jgi:Na+-driven multidrug efflux pump
MEATKAKLNITTEILKFIFASILAIGTAVAVLLVNRLTINNAEQYLTYCYFIIGVIFIALIAIIFTILVLLDKLDHLEN